MTESGEARVTLVADKEADNFKVLVEHVLAHPEGVLDLGGVVVPGGAIETDVLRFISMVVMQRVEGLMPLPLPPEEGQGLEFLIGLQDFEGRFGPDQHAKILEDRALQKCGSFSYIHHPYDKAIKDNPAKRMGYNAMLLCRIMQTAPKIVFLSNFKLILDPFVVQILEQMGITVVNVHPSILPENKGWRTEKSAFLGQNPHASGYTFHIVVPALDSGPVLFNRHVAVPEYDHWVAEIKAKTPEDPRVKAYENSVEEELRQQLIDDQSQFMPLVLEVIASERPRMTVEDREAFVAEGRPDFFDSLEFRASLVADYEHYLKENEKSGRRIMNYAEWEQKVRIPYRRVLFKEGEDWVTLETFLEAESVQIPERRLVQSQFEFHLHVGAYEEGSRRLMEFLDELAKRGIEIGSRTNQLHTHVDGYAFYSMNFETPHRQALETYLQERNIEYEVHSLSTSVVKKRRLSEIFT
ncbi:MAG TPA: formyltransferase family protein [Candidatus Gracilibacteria bacterium]